MIPSLSSHTSLQRLIWLGVVGILLYNFPLVFLPHGSWHGIPAIALYLFIVWALLILGAFTILKWSSTDIQRIQSLRAQQKTIASSPPTKLD